MSLIILIHNFFCANRRFLNHGGYHFDERANEAYRGMRGGVQGSLHGEGRRFHEDQDAGVEEAANRGPLVQ